MSYIIEKEWIYKTYKCVVTMNLNMGFRCGYVGVEKMNILYGLNYSENSDILKTIFKDEELTLGKKSPIIEFCYNGDFTLANCIDVHGGLTYSNGGDNSLYPIESDLWWFGYDCGHYNDAKDLDVIPESLKEIELRFPTGGILRNLDYCINECKGLVDQIYKINLNYTLFINNERDRLNG